MGSRCRSFSADLLIVRNATVVQAQPHFHMSGSICSKVSEFFSKATKSSQVQLPAKADRAKLTLLAADMIAPAFAVDAFVIDPPAVMLRFPALVIEPALKMSLTAIKFRLKSLTTLPKFAAREPGSTDEISAPCRLLILRAAIVPAVTSSLFE